MDLKPCSECGVPEVVTSEHLWLNNGDIVHARAQTSRMVFIETENLDPLFRGIAQIIGSEIEHMIITTGRRAERIYFGSFIPEKMREKILSKELEYEAVDAVFRDLGRLEGVGNYAVVDRRYEQDQNDYDTVSISEPHSVPMAVSAHVGAIEGLTGVDQGYRYEKVSADTYNVTAFPSPHPEGLSKRMWFKPHHHTDGDIELERCSSCGGPRALGGYEWYPERGIIVNKITNRRIALQGDAMLNPVFLELEEELGDVVPGAVVEAQRRFTRSGFYTMEDITDEGDFRTKLALMGLGNLKELVMRKKGMNMRLDNAALHLITVGLSQGFFEIGFNVDTTVDWELSEEGDLQVEVKPLKYT